MRILIVHDQYQQAGGERVAVNAQVSLLRQNGHQVTVYLRDNAEIQHYGFWEKVKFFPQTLYSRRSYHELRTLVEKEQPDIAHIHNVFPLISPVAYRALHDLDVPIVQTMHNFRLLCPNALFYTHRKICELCKHGNTIHAVRLKCYRDSYALSTLYALTIGIHRRWGTFRLIDRFVALTEFTAQKLVDSGLVTRDKIAVIGNFLAEPLPAPGSFEKRESYLVYLGRLSVEKGVDVLLTSMARLPYLRLKVLGDGPLAASLQAMVREKGLTNIEFLGYVTGEMKWEILRRAMATVVPSIWYEHFPFVVLESFAVGTPIVASNLGGLPSLVEANGSGLLFTPNDAEDLHSTITWLFDNPHMALRMGQCGRRFVEKKGTQVVHYMNLIRLYQEVIDGSAGI